MLCYLGIAVRVLSLPPSLNVRCWQILERVPLGKRDDVCTASLLAEKKAGLSRWERRLESFMVSDGVREGVGFDRDANATIGVSSFSLSGRSLADRKSVV